MKKLKVLIGCESSGTIREAFRKLGHDAWSLDILPADDNSPFHIQDDVMNHLEDGWDLAVFHPECTHICVSGARWFPQKIADGSQQAAIDFFMKLVNAPIPKIAIENPIGIMSSRYRKPDCIVQPWWFGDPAFKATCFWLKNLPPLVPTDKLPVPLKGTDEHKLWSAIHRAPPGPDRWKIRSKSFPGMGRAVAEQWGNLPESPGN